MANKKHVAYFFEFLQSYMAGVQEFHTNSCGDFFKQTIKWPPSSNIL